MCFQAALQAAAAVEDKSETASAYTNLGAVHWLWTQLEWELKEDGVNIHIADALECFLQAYELRESGGKSEEWTKGVQAQKFVANNFLSGKPSVTSILSPSSYPH